MPEQNPCLNCGACCALFMVRFDQTETNAYEGGVVPVEYTLKINPTQSAMRGTDRIIKRCAALEGNVGRRVSCAIYGQRPSCCRAFRAAWEKDIVNAACNRARATCALQPFDAF